MRTSVGPFRAEAIEALAREDDELGLRRVLETVCDKVEVARRGGDSWVELTKLTREAA